MAKKTAVRPKRVRTKVVVTKDEPEITDPRQIAFLSGFLDPGSPTYSNALQSAIAAGFSETYADNILHLMPDWLSGTIGKESTKALAQRHLDEVLQLPIHTQAMGAFGPIFTKEESFANKKLKNGKTKKVKVIKKVPVFVINTSIIKQKNDLAKFALEGLDRANYGKQTAKIGFNFNITPNKDRYKE